MSISLQSLGIDRLSVEDRLMLIQAIWESIDPAHAPPPISEELSQELDRRIAKDNAFPDEVVSWEEVKADALNRLKS